MFLFEIKQVTTGYYLFAIKYLLRQKEKSDYLFNLKFNIMNAMRNKVQLIGNLGAKAEIKELEGGRKLAKFSLATNERYKNNKGEMVQKTYWHRLNAWGGLADVIEKYTDKGSEIAVEGKLIYNQFKTKEGEERQLTEIEVMDLLLLGKKNDG